MRQDMPPKPLNFAAAVTPKASPATSPTDVPIVEETAAKTAKNQEQAKPMKTETQVEETKQECDADLVDKGLDNEHPLGAKIAVLFAMFSV